MEGAAAHSFASGLIAVTHLGDPSPRSASALQVRYTQTLTIRAGLGSPWRVEQTRFAAGPPLGHLELDVVGGKVVRGRWIGFVEPSQTPPRRGFTVGESDGSMSS